MASPPILRASQKYPPTIALLAGALLLANCGAPTAPASFEPCANLPPMETIQDSRWSGPSNSGSSGVLDVRTPSRLRITADWTLPTNDIDIYISEPGCKFPVPGLPPTGCTTIATAMGATKSKPEVIDTCVIGGRYVLYNVNRGPSFDSGTFRVEISGGRSSLSNP